jgi:hypothetical protein
MKYLILESRLDKLVQKYITNYVGVLERHSSPTFGRSYIWYTNLNGEMIFEISDTDYGLALGVYESLWSLVKGVLSLSDSDTDRAFLIWMTNNEEKREFEDLYTFEKE